jgi:gliding motility-associated-like protein
MRYRQPSACGQWLRQLAATFLLALCAVVPLSAQTANPTITFHSTEEDADVTLNPGDAQTVAAPCELTFRANVDTEGSAYTNYTCEWRLYRIDEGEDKALLTRFDPDMSYTLTRSGGYGAKLYVTFVSADADTVEYESETFSITISESKLTCPDGFSPNGDGINDVFNIESQSIVKLSGAIFNRWGKKLHTFTLDNLQQGWDGRQGGNYVKDGGYMLSIDAIGSDGLHYKIKKAINVLKGFNETDETTTSN